MERRWTFLNFLWAGGKKQDLGVFTGAWSSHEATAVPRGSRLSDRSFGGVLRGSSHRTGAGGLFRRRHHISPCEKEQEVHFVGLRMLRGVISCGVGVDVGGVVGCCLVWGLVYARLGWCFTEGGVCGGIWKTVCDN